MFAWLNLHVASLVVTALLFGGMASFAFFFAPMVFRLSERADAADFMRRLFPVYERVGCGVAIVAAMPLLPARSYGPEVVTLLAVAAVFLGIARFLLPAAERARESGADRRWRLLHQSSVWVHTVQLVAVLVVLIRLAA